MTKAEEVFTRVEALVSEGATKAEAFRKLADEYGQPVNSVRGSYYQHTRAKNGGSTRTRRRETTAEDAIADARAALERAITNVDREVEVAKQRADETKAEYEAMKASAADRKAAIRQRLDALA